jgi:hypothetical protein
VSQATSEKENVVQQASKLANDVAASKASIANMKAQMDKLDSAMVSIRNEAATADKRAEYSLSLYNKITNITWDYENATPNAVSGCKSI